MSLFFSISSILSQTFQNCYSKGQNEKFQP